MAPPSKYPKDAPAPKLATPEDRARWNEAPLDAPWPEHTLCTECGGKKLCPSCGGDGGCDVCDRRCWCPVCGGAGQWPDDPTAAIYSPAPSSHRVT